LPVKRSGLAVASSSLIDFLADHGIRNRAGLTLFASGRRCLIALSVQPIRFRILSGPPQPFPEPPIVFSSSIRRKGGVTIDALVAAQSPPSVKPGAGGGRIAFDVPNPGSGITGLPLETNRNSRQHFRPSLTPGEVFPLTPISLLAFPPPDTSVILVTTSLLLRSPSPVPSGPPGAFFHRFSRLSISSPLFPFALSSSRGLAVPGQVPNKPLL